MGLRISDWKRKFLEYLLFCGPQTVGNSCFVNLMRVKNSKYFSREILAWGFSFLFFLHLSIGAVHSSLIASFPGFRTFEVCLKLVYKFDIELPSKSKTQCSGGRLRFVVKMQVLIILLADNRSWVFCPHRIGTGLLFLFSIVDYQCFSMALIICFFYELKSCIETVRCRAFFSANRWLFLLFFNKFTLWLAIFYFFFLLLCYSVCLAFVFWTDTSQTSCKTGW